MSRGSSSRSEAGGTVAGGIRSMARFGWAMSLFGVRQTAEVLAALGTARAPRRAAAAFDALAKAAAGQLGERLEDTYRDGDRWQGELVDAVFRAFAPAVDLSRAFASQALVRGSFRAFRETAAMLEAATPAAGRVVWQELGNKLEAFESFRYADRVLGFEELPEAGFRDRVEQADGSDPFLALWLTEGLGFAFAEAAWESGEPRELLRRPALEDLPGRSLIPLHTGMGLSLARQLLPEVDPADPSADVAAGLERFRRLCRSNSRDGYALAAWEALGLVVRQLAPEAAGEIDRVLARDGSGDGERLRGAFWHGVGRGLYFVASQLVPGSLGRSAFRVRREAAAGTARRNALAGLAWAVTLVNFRQPAVLEAWLKESRLDDDGEAAVAGGIASAMLLWLDVAGEEGHYETFRDHRPESGTAERWRRMVIEPAERARAGWPAVKNGPGPGEIFYQSALSAAESRG